MAMTILEIEQAMRMASYIATPIVAVAATVIAWQQMKINHRKLQADQYDRRLRIYEEVRKILSLAMRDGDLSTEALLQFRTSVSEADFLFGPEVMKYIEEIYSRGLNLWRWNEEYRTPKDARAPDYDHKKVVSEKYKELRWLVGQFEPAKQMFKKYLDISR